MEPPSHKQVIAVLHKVQQERRLVVLLETTMIGVELALLFVLEWVEAQVERATKIFGIQTVVFISHAQMIFLLTKPDA